MENNLTAKGLDPYQTLITFENKDKRVILEVSNEDFPSIGLLLAKVLKQQGIDVKIKIEDKNE